MLTLTLATLLGATADPEVEACAGRELVLSDHIADVCDDWLDGATAYSATLRIDMLPRPASRQVMLFRLDGEWRLRIAGYQREPDTYAVLTRRHEVAISEVDAQRIIGLMQTNTVARLADQPFYGTDDRICLHGASLELALAVDGQRHSARQHSCAGETELSRISAVFREIALEYDADFEGMLAGL